MSRRREGRWGPSAARDAGSTLGLTLRRTAVWSFCCVGLAALAVWVGGGGTPGLAAFDSAAPFSECELLFQREFTSVVVTGYHHSGTTILQTQLCRQPEKVCLYKDSGRPREHKVTDDGLCEYMVRASHADRAARGFVLKKPSNDAPSARAMAELLRKTAPGITIAVCVRDPASTAFSLTGRAGGLNEDAVRTNLRNQREVNAAWAAAAAQHPGRVVFVPLEAFSRDPNHYLRAILGLPDGVSPLRPAVLMDANRTVADLHLPGSKAHDDRRARQSQLPVYPVAASDWRNAAKPADVAAIDRLVAEAEAEAEASRSVPPAGQARPVEEQASSNAAGLPSLPQSR